MSTFCLVQCATDARNEHSSKISRKIAAAAAARAVIWISCLFPDSLALARGSDRKQRVTWVIGSDVISGDVMTTKEVI